MEFPGKSGGPASAGAEYGVTRGKGAFNRFCSHYWDRGGWPFPAALFPARGPGPGSTRTQGTIAVRSAIILVGGEARRAGGQEKYFFRFNGRTFLEHILESLRGVVDDVVLAARDPAQCERFAHIPGLRCVPDHRQGIGPLGGLHAGVHAVRGDPVFVSACDMPCINGRVVALLFSVMESGPWDAVIPAWDPEMIEPLHAVYRRQPLLDYLESHEHLSMRAMVRSMNARYLSIDEIRALDPDLRTFTNINRPEDLERISREWGGPGREPPAGSL